MMKHSTEQKRRPHLRVSTLALFLSLLCLILFRGSIGSGQENGNGRKRSITVDDAIGMTRLADQKYFEGGPGAGEVAHFSSDGKQFVVLLEKGNLLKNVNEFKVVLFHVLSPSSVQDPLSILTMASSSNRPAIQSPRWLSDNRTLVFIGEQPDRLPQVYKLDVQTRHLLPVTRHPTAVTDFDFAKNGRELIFTAKSPGRPRLPDFVRIRNQSLIQLFDCSEGALPWRAQELFVQRPGHASEGIPIPPGRILVGDTTHLMLSPDGHYGLMTAWIENVPAEWRGYRDRLLHDVATASPRRGQPSHLQQFLLLDVQTRKISPLLDAPVFGEPAAHWGSDGETVYLHDTWLPLGAHEPPGMDVKGQKYDVKITLADKALEVVTATAWANQLAVTRPVRVELKENINTPPALVVSELGTRRVTFRMTLNPQFKRLIFGKVSSIEWPSTDGHTVLGGLYFPPNYQSGKRYPLVIQTHGFEPNQFSMDGRSEWSSAFAARPLAARGIMVLQVGASKSRTTSKYSDTSREGPRAMAEYEGAIDYLDNQGLIDRDRVGIVGFSRTVFAVAYTLTHSRYHFGAACLVDGIDGGYFQEIAFGPGDGAFLNRAEPFGQGLQTWFKNSPAFNLEKMRTPVRLVALGPGGVLETWEWFALLSRLSRPVESVYLPHAAHLIVKPRERAMAEKGLLDWFCHWLNGGRDNQLPAG